MKCSWIGTLLLAALCGAIGPRAIAAQLGLTHRYSFTAGATDSVGTAHGTLQGVATVGGGVLNFNNPNFAAPAPGRGYLSLPAGILPTSGSVTIEQWFTFGPSGYSTQAYSFRNAPGARSTGQFLMHTVFTPLPANPPGGPNTGGSHITQGLFGWGGPPPATYAHHTTPGLGVQGGGYVDDGLSHMAATVIDATAGTLSYYIYRLSDGLGGLQQTIPAIPLSSYSFNQAFLGRSAWDVDNYINGTVDEFRIYNRAKTAAEIAADFAAGPSVVPEPASTVLGGVVVAGLLAAAGRRGFPRPAAKRAILTSGDDSSQLD
jgi:hypothetical protein